MESGGVGGVGGGGDGFFLKRFQNIFIVFFIIIIICHTIQSDVIMRLFLLAVTFGVPVLLNFITYVVVNQRLGKHKKLH